MSERSPDREALSTDICTLLFLLFSYFSLYCNVVFCIQFLNESTSQAHLKSDNWRHKALPATELQCDRRLPAAWTPHPVPQPISGLDQVETSSAARLIRDAVSVIELEGCKQISIYRTISIPSRHLWNGLEMRITLWDAVGLPRKTNRSWAWLI